MLDSAAHRAAAAPRRAGLALLHCFVLNLYVALFVPAVASAQTASLRGQVVDSDRRSRTKGRRHVDRRIWASAAPSVGEMFAVAELKSARAGRE